MAESSVNAGSHRKRNIAVVAVIIAVVLVAFVVYLGFFSGGSSIFNNKPFDFSLTVKPSTKEFLPGDYFVAAAVNVNSTSANTKEVLLNASGGPSGTIFNFTNAGVLTPNASCGLWIRIPDTASIGNYNVTVNAEGGGKTYSSSYTITILKTNITAYGSIYIEGEEASGAHPTAVQFQGMYESKIYTANIVGDTYSVVLRNQQAYAITVFWEDASGQTGSFNGGVLDINAPIGVDSIGQNLTNLVS